jgi:hypothetical protein
MRRSRSRTAALCCVLAGCAGTASAQSPGAVEGGAFLLLPIGARATALGQAAVADGGSTESLFWNPAGLARMSRSELALHHYAGTTFYGAGDAAVFSLVSPLLGTFTLGAYLVDYGDLDVTLPGGGTVGRVTPRNVALYAGFATDVAGGVAIGINYKMAQFRVDCSGDCSFFPPTTGTTHAVDFGLQWHGPGGLPVTVGAAVRNLGFKLQVKNQAQADPLPTRLQVGVAWQAMRPSVGGERLDVRVLADMQGAVGTGALEPVSLLGFETGVRDVVRLRAGYAFLDSQARGPSIGFGFTFGSLTLDLARIFYSSDALADEEPLHVSFRWTF